MKKSIIALILAFVFVLGLASCTNDSGNPTNNPSTPTSTEPSDNNTPDGSGDDENSGAESVADFFDSATADYELPMFMDLDDDMLKDTYGIEASMLDEYVAKVPMMNVQATEFFIAKVKDGNMAAVKDGISNRLESLDATWSTYLPDQYELVQNHKLVEEGDYILFAIGENAEAVASAFSAAYGK